MNLEIKGVYGPILSVYGSGTLIIVLLLKRFQNRPFFFFTTMLVTGVLEYETGMTMYVIWKQSWLDYTNYAFNLDRYVYLRSAICFDIAGLF